MAIENSSNDSGSKIKTSAQAGESEPTVLAADQKAENKRVMDVNTKEEALSFFGLESNATQDEINEKFTELRRNSDPGDTTWENNKPDADLFNKLQEIYDQFLVLENYDYLNKDGKKNNVVFDANDASEVQLNRPETGEDNSVVEKDITEHGVENRTEKTDSDVAPKRTQPDTGLEAGEVKKRASALESSLFGVKPATPTADQSPVMEQSRISLSIVGISKLPNGSFTLASIQKDEEGNDFEVYTNVSLETVKNIYAEAIAQLNQEKSNGKDAVFDESSAKVMESLEAIPGVKAANTPPSPKEPVHAEIDTVSLSDEEFNAVQDEFIDAPTSTPLSPAKPPAAPSEIAEDRIGPEEFARRKAVFEPKKPKIDQSSDREAALLSEIEPVSSPAEPDAEKPVKVAQRVADIEAKLAQQNPQPMAKKTKEKVVTPKDADQFADREAELRAEIEQLKFANKDLKSGNESLKKQNDALGIQLESQQAEFNLKQDEFSRQLAAMQEQIKGLNKTPEPAPPDPGDATPSAFDTAKKTLESTLKLREAPEPVQITVPEPDKDEIKDDKAAPDQKKPREFKERVSALKPEDSDKNSFVDILNEVGGSGMKTAFKNRAIDAYNKEAAEFNEGLTVIRNPAPATAPAKEMPMASAPSTQTMNDSVTACKTVYQSMKERIQAVMGKTKKIIQEESPQNN